MKTGLTKLVWWKILLADIRSQIDENAQPFSLRQNLLFCATDTTHSSRSLFFINKAADTIVSFYANFVQIEQRFCRKCLCKRSWILPQHKLCLSGRIIRVISFVLRHFFLHFFRLFLQLITKVGQRILDVIGQLL